MLCEKKTLTPLWEPSNIPHVVRTLEIKLLHFVRNARRVPVPRNASHDAAFELPKTMKALLLGQLRDMKQREQIELLDRAGFGQSEIAALIGTTAKAVSVRLTEIRKAARKRGKK